MSFREQPRRRQFAQAWVLIRLAYLFQACHALFQPVNLGKLAKWLQLGIPSARPSGQVELVRLCLCLFQMAQGKRQLETQLACPSDRVEVVRLYLCLFQTARGKRQLEIQSACPSGRVEGVRLCLCLFQMARVLSARLL